MPRGSIGILVAAVLIALLAGPAAAQPEEKIAGKTPAEWLTILRGHKETRYRRAALIALEVVGPKAKGVAPALLGALHNDPEPLVRTEAALTLGRMGPDAEGAAAGLAQSLRHDKAEAVREAAARALGGKLAEHDAQEHVDGLAAALKDAHPGTRSAAAEALKNMGEAARPAVPALLTVARDRKEDRFPRAFAVQIIGRHGKDNPETPAVLVEVLADREAPATVREAAADALGRISRPSDAALTALSQALQENAAPADEPAGDPKKAGGGTKRANVRLAAAAALAALGPQAKDAWPAVKAGLADPDNGLRYQLIRAAGGIGKENPDAVKSLADLARKEEAAENRAAAVQELGALGPLARDVAPVLEGVAANDVRASVREAAAAALKKVRGE